MITDNWELISEEYNEHKNELVLSNFRVCLLFGIEDNIEDYYWIMCEYGGKITYESCVGGWIPLKEVISEKEYSLMVNIWNLNNVKQAQ